MSLTRKAAAKRAKELWGRGAFAARVSHPVAEKRCIVGVVGFSGQLLPFAQGRTFDQALERGIKKQIPAELLAQLRGELAPPKDLKKLER